MWQDCHPSKFHCDKKPHSRYGVTDGKECSFFDDWQEAEAFFIQKTGERSLDELLIKKI